MNMRRSLPLAATLAAAVGLAVAQPAFAGTARTGHPATTQTRAVLPNPSARAAGVAPSGGGYAGWSLEASPNRRMSQSRMSAGPVRALQSGGVLGIDVAAYQGNVDWASYARNGYGFAYVKATEGTYYRSQYFSSQYTGSAAAGLIRGAYHFANPGWTGGAAQADYFVAHGGGWSRDGRTLPGMVDLETNPYGSMCYGLTPSQMTGWIQAFTGEYRRRTGRDAVIYTTYTWWKTCTGNTARFNQTDPLWIARWAGTPGTLPGGWPYYTIWQYSATTVDRNQFNGSLSRLRSLALG